MLRVGGVVVLDDCGFPSLRKLARFLAIHPSVHVYKSFPTQISAQTNDWRKVALSRLCNLLPQKEQIFAPSILKLDTQLGINTQCIAFQKVSEDSREWNWFGDF
jgi:hypothetical protein